MNAFTVHDIPLDEIKFFVRRARNAADYARMKASIKANGLHVPVQVQSITHLPASKRRRPGGGNYRYMLICGQGRLQAHRELGIPRIPAVIVETKDEADVASRFLAENVIRRSQSWAEKAQLMKRDVDAGKDAKELASIYKLSMPQVFRYLRVLNRADPSIDKELKKLSLADADKLTSLPTRGQTLVVDFLNEPENAENAPQIIQKARELEDSGGLSRAALAASLAQTTDDLKAVRESLKPVRLHWALGPQNLQTLLADPKVAKALSKLNVNTGHFLKLIEQ